MERLAQSSTAETPQTIVLLGPEGSGKTLLLRRLGQLIAARGQVVRLLDGVLPETTDDTDVLLVDEAESLDDTALLAHCKAPPCFTVLAVSSDHAGRLTDIAPDWMRVTLNPMRRGEVAEFATFQRARTGSTGAALSDDRVAELARRSGGVPGVMIRMLDEAADPSNGDDAQGQTVWELSPAQALDALPDPGSPDTIPAAPPWRAASSEPQPADILTAPPPYRPSPHRQHDSSMVRGVSASFGMTALHPADFLPGAPPDAFRAADAETERISPLDVPALAQTPGRAPGLWWGVVAGLVLLVVVGSLWSISRHRVTALDGARRPNAEMLAAGAKPAVRGPLPTADKDATQTDPMQAEFPAWRAADNRVAPRVTASLALAPTVVAPAAPGPPRGGAQTAPVVPVPVPPPAGFGSPGTPPIAATAESPTAPPPQAVPLVPTSAVALPTRAPGLVLVAQAGDTLAGLYREVYSGASAPPFAVLLAANPGPIKPGSRVIFPPPPYGWASR
jgi:energy-coupling factor transporter ATP-binding protein EcfA2